MTIDALTRLVTEGLAAQDAATGRWHSEDPAALDPDTDATPPAEALCGLILAQHLRNFRLWHVEDVARRKDVGPEVIADCKYRIDRLNQERNDRMERVDACLMALLAPLLPELAPGARARQNTESLGMAVDRLSILSLKIWHMAEQTRREDVDAAHIRACEAKLAVLEAQRADLAQAVCDLLEEFASGTKRPKLYFQFKMYNDPSLNPELYGNNAHGL